MAQLKRNTTINSSFTVNTEDDSTSEDGSDVVIDDGDNANNDDEYLAGDESLDGSSIDVGLPPPKAPKPTTPVSLSRAVAAQALSKATGSGPVKASSSPGCASRHGSGRKGAAPPPLLPSLDNQRQQQQQQMQQGGGGPGSPKYFQWSYRSNQSMPGNLTLPAAERASASPALPSAHVSMHDRSSAPPLVTRNSTGTKSSTVAMSAVGPVSPKQPSHSVPSLPAASASHALSPTIRSRAPKQPLSPQHAAPGMHSPFAAASPSQAAGAGGSKASWNGGSGGGAPPSPTAHAAANPHSNTHTSGSPAGNRELARTSTPGRAARKAAPQLLPSLEAQRSETMLVVHDRDAAAQLGLANAPASQQPTESRMRALTPPRGSLQRNSSYVQFSIRHRESLPPRLSSTGCD